MVTIFGAAIVIYIIKISGMCPSDYEMIRVTTFGTGAEMELLLS